MSDLDQQLADAVADIDDGGAVDMTPAPVETSATEPATEVATTDPAAPPAPAVIEDDDFDKVAERGPDGRFQRIPHPRVKAMVGKAAEKARNEAIAEREAQFREAFGLKAEDPYDYKPVAERYRKAAEYEQQVQSLAAVERMMAEKPEEFLRNLAEQIPAYRQYLPQAAARQQAAAQSSGAPEPEPDLDLGDGRRTYSVQGLQRLREWDRAESARLAKEEMSQEFSKRFEPFEQQQRVAKLQETAQQRIATLKAETAKWPQFAENENAILDRMRSAYPNAAPEVAINAAYRDVVIPKLQTNEADLRKKIIAEMNAKPKATSAASAPVPAAGGATLSAEDKLTADLRQNLERLGIK